MRAILAAAFLVVLLAEWGSHAVICDQDHSAGDAQAMSQAERGHEDPCQTLVLCSDNKQRDRQTPTFSHDATSHNGLVDVFAALLPKLSAMRDAEIVTNDSAPIYRPPKPPFHPPKQA